jgi:hypothetical protein
VMSGSGFAGKSLEKQQIELRRFAGKAGQQGMDLPAVVGLVIEPVRQCRGQLLLELFRRRDPAVFGLPQPQRAVGAA